MLPVYIVPLRSSPEKECLAGPDFLKFHFIQYHVPLGNQILPIFFKTVTLFSMLIQFLQPNIHFMC